MKFLLLSLLMLPVFSAKAILGESSTQMQARFGPNKVSLLDNSPFGDIAGLTQRAYERSDVLCFAYFRGEACVCEAYARTDHDWLSHAQLDVLLQANAFGQPWIHSSTSDHQDDWSKADKSAHAFCLFVPGSIRYTIFNLPVFDEMIAIERKRKSDAEKLEASFLSDPNPAPPKSLATPARPAIPPHTPMPPYPYQAKAKHEMGSGVVRVSFDASGRCASVTVIQSTGSGILDNNTVNWAMSNWTGAANTTANVPINYVLH